MECAPTGVGVDSKDYAYVANFPNLFGGGPDAITVYEPYKASAVRDNQRGPQVTGNPAGRPLRE